MKRISLSKKINISDVSIVDLIVNHNKQDEYKHIFNKYYTHTFNRIMRATNQDKDLAADLTIVALTKVFTNIKSYKQMNGTTFNAWLTRVVDNTVIDYFRKKNTEPESISIDKEVELHNSSDSSKPMQYQFVDETPNAQDVVIEEEKKQKIRSIINSLDKIYKDVLNAVYLQSMSYEEAANKLKIDMPCLKVRLLRAKEKMKAKLQTSVL